MSLKLRLTKKVAGKVKLELAQFRELAAFSQFESDLDAATKARLDRGARIVEMFKQGAYEPVPVEIQTAIMWECRMISLTQFQWMTSRVQFPSLKEYLYSQGKEVCEGIYSTEKLEESTKWKTSIIAKIGKELFPELISFTFDNGFIQGHSKSN